LCCRTSRCERCTRHNSLLDRRRSLHLAGSRRNSGRVKRPRETAARSSRCTRKTGQAYSRETTGRHHSPRSPQLTGKSRATEPRNFGLLRIHTLLQFSFRACSVTKRKSRVYQPLLFVSVSRVFSNWGELLLIQNLTRICCTHLVLVQFVHGPEPLLRLTNLAFDGVKQRVAPWLSLSCYQCLLNRSTRCHRISRSATTSLRGPKSHWA
jgi:hypothetical protein